MDLGDLLPEALQWAFDRSTEEKPDKEKRKTFPIETIADWVMTFATFTAVRVQLAPDLAVPLTTYLAIITRLAREVPGLAWQRYDRMFRQSAAGNPTLQWDRREPDIWLAAIADSPGSHSQTSSRPISHQPERYAGVSHVGNAHLAPTAAIATSVAFANQGGTWHGTIP